METTTNPRPTTCPMECGAPVVLDGMLVRNADGSPHDCDRPLSPGDRVEWDGSDGETYRGKVSRTPRQEPWLGRCAESIEVHHGEDPTDEGSFTTVPPADLRRAEWRCTCCDGPDGLGVHHIRGGVKRLAMVEARGDLPTDGAPILVEDWRGRLIVELADRDEVIEFLSQIEVPA